MWVGLYAGAAEPFLALIVGLSLELCWAKWAQYSTVTPTAGRAGLFSGLIAIGFCLNLRFLSHSLLNDLAFVIGNIAGAVLGVVYRKKNEMQ